MSIARAHIHIYDPAATHTARLKRGSADPNRRAHAWIRRARLGKVQRSGDSGDTRPARIDSGRFTRSPSWDLTGWACGRLRTEAGPESLRRPVMNISLRTKRKHTRRFLRARRMRRTSRASSRSLRPRRRKRRPAATRVRLTKVASTHAEQETTASFSRSDGHRTHTVAAKKKESQAALCRVHVMYV